MDVGNIASPPYMTLMTDDEFDASLVGAAFNLGATEGWGKVSAAAAARYAGLDMVRARTRFPGRGAVLRRFGSLADAHALTGALQEGSVKERLFDILLRRFDFLQLHRAGVEALLRTLPLDPGMSAWLTRETTKSMGWMLEGAGVGSRGLRGELAKSGLTAVWAWGMRAWLRDISEDLSATMAAVDIALVRADQIAARFSPKNVVPEETVPKPEPADLYDPAPPLADLPLTVAADTPPDLI